jgi:benzoyl-CoA 2,3-dioxygenase component B
VLDAAAWHANHDRWLPSDADRAYVTSLMGPAITEPGKFANWIAPPARGINNQPGDFAYVRFN